MNQRIQSILLAANSISNTSVVFKPENTKITINKLNKHSKRCSLDKSSKENLRKAKEKIKVLIQNKRKRVNAGKQKLRKFFQGITKFENNLKQHRRHLNNLLMKQEESKDQIYKKYKSVNKSLGHSVSKPVGLSVNNFSIVKRDTSFLQFKPIKRKKLKQQVEIKEAKNPFKEYISNMFGKRKKKESGFELSQDFFVSNHLDYKKKHSLKERLVNYKNNVLCRKKSKDLVQILLFQNLLISFIKRGDLKRVKKILDKEKEIVYKVCEKDLLPVQYALQTNNYDMFALVLEKSLENTIKFENKKIDLLQDAYNLNNSKMVKLLLEKGFEPVVKLNMFNEEYKETNELVKRHYKVS